MNNAYKPLAINGEDRPLLIWNADARRALFARLLGLPGHGRGWRFPIPPVNVTEVSAELLERCPQDSTQKRALTWRAATKKLLHRPQRPPPPGFVKEVENHVPHGFRAVCLAFFLM